MSWVVPAQVSPTADAASAPGRVRPTGQGLGVEGVGLLQALSAVEVAGVRAEVRAALRGREEPVWTYLWGLCLPCLSLSRIHCQTFWERSVASRGRRGEERPSPLALIARLLLKEGETQGKPRSPRVRQWREVHLRGAEVSVSDPCWRAEALQALGRLRLHLLLGPGRSVVMVDVVVMDVLRGRSGRVSTQGGSRGTAPVRRAGARRVAGHARRLAAGGLQDAGQVLVQDGLRVFVALVGGAEQTVLEGGAAKQVGALLSLLLLDGAAEQKGGN